MIKILCDKCGADVTHRPRHEVALREKDKHDHQTGSGRCYTLCQRCTGQINKAIFTATSPGAKEES